MADWNDVMQARRETNEHIGKCLAGIGKARDVGESLSDVCEGLVAVAYAIRELAVVTDYGNDKQ